MSFPYGVSLPDDPREAMEALGVVSIGLWTALLLALLQRAIPLDEVASIFEDATQIANDSHNDFAVNLIMALRSQTESAIERARTRGGN
jgi:hypothetical protein